MVVVVSKKKRPSRARSSGGRREALRSAGSMLMTSYIEGASPARRRLLARVSISPLPTSGGRPAGACGVAVGRSRLSAGSIQKVYNERAEEEGASGSRWRSTTRGVGRRTTTNVNALYLRVMVAWMRPLGLETGSKTSTPPARPLPFSRPKAPRLMGLRRGGGEGKRQPRRAGTGWRGSRAWHTCSGRWGASTRPP